ncbi:MAG: hypothetical protein SPK60_06610, partial [Sodaliphilus sp.]|nr:hypothetical protein [Bacteroidales bacterium]MDY5706580.1 hypothetical protein [Sodaliphilus sp.]
GRGSPQIPALTGSFASLGSHRSHGIARLVVNLTDAPRSLAPLGSDFASHRSHRSHGIARLALNLTDASRLLLKAYLIRFLHLFNPFKPYLHLIKINKKIGVNGFLMD